jgi:hypothetical protein
MGTATIAETFSTYLENPFHGPSPLREGDPIFGRDREIKLLRDQLLSDRLVLLHAISGCGKTSLVEAGLRPLLRKRFKPFPDDPHCAYQGRVTPCQQAGGKGCTSDCARSRTE